MPDGYKPIKFPEVVNINNEVVSIQSNYVFNAMTETLYFTAAYAFKKGVYQPKEYKLLRESIDQIVESMNKRIYLTKK